MVVALRCVGEGLVIRWRLLYDTVLQYRMYLERVSVSVTLMLTLS